MPRPSPESTTGGRWSRVRAAVVVSALAAAVPGLAQPPDGPLPGSRSDRAALEAEQAVARRLARLDEELALGTFPDASPYWPARLAASIEARDHSAPAQELLRAVAVELRRIGIAWALGGSGTQRPDRRPTVATTIGRERAERVDRIRELVDRVDRKLGLRENSLVTSSPEPRSLRYASNACPAASPISLDGSSGYTHGATSDGSSSCEGPGPSPDVWYTFTAPYDGTYTFQTVHPDAYYQGWDTVLSLHSACPSGADAKELACSDDALGTLQSLLTYSLTQGETVWVRVAGYGGATVTFELSVSIGRTVQGRVTREGTGEALEGASVEILNGTESVISAATTGADGSYTAEVPGSEAVWARARDVRFITEIYDNFECPFTSICLLWNGHSFPTLDSDVSGIDFTLQPGATISGSVTAADTGAPLDDELTSGYAYIYVFDGPGAFLGSVRVEEDGTYDVSSLPSGTYRLRTSAYNYQDEVWDNVPCDPGCDPAAGSPIVVSGGDHVTGIDFALDRQGSIRGVLTDESTGEPIAREPVYLYDETGTFNGSDFSASDGAYELSTLPAGTYYVHTSVFRSHLNELYDDIPCEPTCDYTSGTPVVVSLNAPTTGIDFALVAKATISGIVTDAETGDPISSTVHLYDSSGYGVASVRTSSTTGEPGTYVFEGRSAGSYYVKAAPQTHENEIYDDVPCTYASCDPTAGTAVVTTERSQVTGIDFQLERRGFVSGMVRRAADGSPLSGVMVRAYHLDGSPAGAGYTEVDGSYEIRLLAAGSYRIGTDSGLYRDRMYDGVICGNPCDRTTGAAIVVSSKLETPGIDFTLARLGSISGVVVSGTDGYLDSDIDLLDSAGGTVATTYAGPDFTFEGVEPGTYYLLARARFYEGVQDELYDDVPCEPDCELSGGTPIVVGIETVLTGLDFRLAPCPVESREEVVSTTIDGYYKAVACDQVTASDVLMMPGADLLLSSGRSVVLGDGFAMEPGARLRVVIEPTWSDD